MSAEHSNTIDLNTIRLQRNEATVRPAPLLLPISLSELRQHLTLLLQSSLMLERILELFLREVQRLVPLDGLTFQHPDDNTLLELGQSAPHAASYRLRHEGEALGELSFTRAQRFSEEELGQLESLLSSVLFPLRNGLLYRSAVQSSRRDPLTGVGNRAAMNQALQREIDLARRTQLPLSILMIDIDHFKRINDNYGHGVGDEVLKAVAQELNAQLRTVDMLFRYGGEEFLVVLSNTSQECAGIIAERLRHSIEKLQHSAAQANINLTISLGCATWATAQTCAQLQEQADRALFRAKREGRNRLYHAEPASTL